MQICFPQTIQHPDGVDCVAAKNPLTSNFSQVLIAQSRERCSSLHTGMLLSHADFHTLSIYAYVYVFIYGITMHMHTQ